MISRLSKRAGTEPLKVIPDYRLAGAKEDPAKYPDGAEDLSLALQWLASSGKVPQADISKTFLLGTSYVS